MLLRFVKIFKISICSPHISINCTAWSNNPPNTYTLVWARIPGYQRDSLPHAVPLKPLPKPRVTPQVLLHCQQKHGQWGIHIWVLLPNWLKCNCHWNRILHLTISNLIFMNVFFAWLWSEVVCLVLVVNEPSWQHRLCCHHLNLKFPCWFY